MKRLKSLDGFQKAILIIMIVMSAIFAVLYTMTISKVGYMYENTILVPTQENGSTKYSGKIKGEQASFTVSGDSVTYQYGDKTYGPYTMIEDKTAIPKEYYNDEEIVGIEIHEGDSVWFRGGAMDLGEFNWLISKDGTYNSILGSTSIYVGDVEVDEGGNPIKTTEPTPIAIYEMLNHPKLTHKGDILLWVLGLVVCIINAISILFVEELFRWNLSFRINNVDKAEPSDWEIAGRYIGWIGLPIMALVIYIMGLR